MPTEPNAAGRNQPRTAPLPPAGDAAVPPCGPGLCPWWRSPIIFYRERKTPKSQKWDNRSLGQSRGGIPPTLVIGVWPEAEKCMAQRDSHRLLPAQLVMISGRRNGEVDAASTRSREKRPMRGCLRRIPTRVSAWIRSEWLVTPRSLP